MREMLTVEEVKNKILVLRRKLDKTLEVIEIAKAVVPTSDRCPLKPAIARFEKEFEWN